MILDVGKARNPTSVACAGMAPQIYASAAAASAAVRAGYRDERFRGRLGEIDYPNYLIHLRCCAGPLGIRAHISEACKHDRGEESDDRNDDQELYQGEALTSLCVHISNYSSLLREAGNHFFHLCKKLFARAIVRNDKISHIADCG